MIATLETMDRRQARALLEQAKAEYLAGESLWSLANRYHGRLSRKELRDYVGGLMRPRCQPKAELSEEEIERLRDEIKAKWSEEVTKKRWMGRYLSKPQEVGEAFSAMLRDMGGQE